jgi:4'-phosphopantetheinyl transferase
MEFQRLRVASMRSRLQHPEWAHARDVPRLSISNVQVWRVGLGSPTAADISILNDDERQRWSRFRQPHANRFAIARIALRRILAHQLGVAFNDVRITQCGTSKPLLAAPHDDVSLSFNISHSHELALVAVAGVRDVGIDIERIRKVEHSVDIARRFFAPSEYALIQRAAEADRAALFTRSWTAKEAVTKCLGLGLSMPLNDFAVRIGPECTSVEWFIGERPDLIVRSFAPQHGYVAAIATPLAITEVHYVDYTGSN